jgi:hypothetical protein
MATGVETVPLIPRRRLVGSAFGGFTSIRRGEGTDIASSRPYEPGDHFRTIDWKASARLSAAHGSDEFIVRERLSEEMSRVVLVVDRSPEMALYPRELPWLHKPAAVAAAVELIVASAVNQRALVGYVDLARREGESDEYTPFWQPPRPAAGAWQGDLGERMLGFLQTGWDAPSENVALALEFLITVRSSIPIGAFVFVVSDFTAPVASDVWLRALEQGWDLVPVIVQDPVWEQSFPRIDGVLTAVTDPGTGRIHRVRLSSDEVEARRRANEERLASLTTDFGGLGFDSILVDRDDRDSVHETFMDWSENRILLRGSRW